MCTRCCLTYNINNRYSDILEASFRFWQRSLRLLQNCGPLSYLINVHFLLWRSKKSQVLCQKTFVFVQTLHAVPLMPGCVLGERAAFVPVPVPEKICFSSQSFWVFLVRA